MTDSMERDLFAGTADYYVRYRSEYPAELIDRLVERFALDANSRVLDLGCGPGKLGLRFAPCVREVVGLDPDPGMLAAARQVADARGITNVRWVRGCAEEIDPALGEFTLATIGHAFHWMNQDRVLAGLYDRILSGGGVANVADARDSRHDSGFRDIVAEVKKRYLGERRRAGSGYYLPPKELHEAVIARSRFRMEEPIQCLQSRTWTIDEIVGHCYSTSSCSIAVLGDKKEAFEADLRAALAAANPSGVFVASQLVEANIARKG